MTLISIHLVDRLMGAVPLVYWYEKYICFARTFGVLASSLSEMYVFKPFEVGWLQLCFENIGVSDKDI